MIRLRPQSAKKKDGRMLALVGAIGEIITCRRAVQRPETPLVFYRIQHGKVWPVERFDKAWRTARAQAGLSEARIFTTFDAPPSAI